MTPFDFVKDILYKKENIMDGSNEGDYVPFVVNRSISVYPDTLFFVNDMNMNPHISERMQFDYLYHSIGKTYRPFNQYPKKAKTENIDLIRQAYKYSVKKARAALEVLTDEQIEIIRKRFEYGRDKDSS